MRESWWQTDRREACPPCLGCLGGPCRGLPNLGSGSGHPHLLPCRRLNLGLATPDRCVCAAQPPPASSWSSASPFYPLESSGIPPPLPAAQHSAFCAGPCLCSRHFYPAVTAQTTLGVGHPFSVAPSSLYTLHLHWAPEVASLPSPHSLKLCEDALGLTQAQDLV